MKPIFERILELTGTFETSKLPPESYGVTVGNFDGAGMSFGILQFNLLSGTLQPILREMIAKHPNLVKSCFGSLYPELQEMLDTRSTKAQIEWAKKRTINCRPLRPEWRDAFRCLGITPECIELQRKIAREKYFSRAIALWEQYGLCTERGLALMFDIAVQNWSIKPETKEKIFSDFKKIIPNGNPINPCQIEAAKLKIIANRRAEASNPRWVENVRRRKLVIATGYGTANGVTIDLEKQFNLKLAKVNVEEVKRG